MIPMEDILWYVVTFIAGAVYWYTGYEPDEENP